MTSEIATQVNRDNRSIGVDVPLSASMLQRENRAFRGKGGVSQENHQAGFRPAFYDIATHCIYLSRYPDGRPAPCHLLDGLPEEVIMKRNSEGRASTVKPTLVSGFIRDGLFYSRAQAAQLLSQAG